MMHLAHMTPCNIRYTLRQLLCCIGRALVPCSCLCSSASDRGRFSYFGGRGGPLWQRISYKLPTPSDSSETQAEHPARDRPLEHGRSDRSANPNPPLPETGTQPDINHQADMPQHLKEPNSCHHLPPSQHLSPPYGHHPHEGLPCQSAQQHGILTIEDVDHHITQQQVSVWDYLQHQLQVHRLEIADESAQQLPFDFWGGFVGYLGYELKAECGGENAHQAPTPDAAMFLADRYFTAMDLHSC